jgi:nucleoside-diphosphate-sugar epimerase
MRVLVTGAAGFLGFHLSLALARRGDVELFCVDNLLRGEDDAPYRALAARPNVTRIDLDLADEKAVAELPGELDYVYHLAALNGTQNFYERPLTVIRACTLPTIFLAERYGAQPTPLKRLVYAGTSESYASIVTRFGWPVPTGEDVPLGIDDVANPRWSYAGSKLHGEIVIAQAARACGFPMTIIRYHNAYGPRMGDKHVIPDFMARMREGRYELFGHADTRSFIYADDAVRATIALAETESCAGEIVNIGGERELTMLQLGREMMRIRGLDNEIVLHPSPPGSVKRRAPDIGKLKRLTGYAERVGLDEGLRATAAYYLDGALDGVLPAG